MVGMGYRSLDFDDDDLIGAMLKDDSDLFIYVLEQQRDKYCGGHKKQAILDQVCYLRAIKCAEALVAGQTPVIVDLNLPCCPHNTGMLPLHRLVYLGPDDPSMTELLLYYGARTDIRFNLLDNHHLQGKEEETIKQFVNMLPLQMVLYRKAWIFGRYYSREWTPKESIYKLITIICLPRLQNKLETIALLSGTTKEIGEIFFEYAMEGKIVELACLLVAAPKEKLQNVIDRVQQYCQSLAVGNNNNNTTITLPVEGQEDQRETLACIKLLLEVFDKAGDRISEYVKENKLNVSKDQTIRDVKEILRETGFHVIDSEVDLSDDSRFELRGKDSGDMFESTRRLVDFDMVHYSKSGYRWKVSSKDRWLDILDHEAYINELENEVKRLKGENVKIETKRQQLNLQISMDDELRDALENDDKEEFLSVIDRNVAFFRYRQQQILYNVCCYGSIKCAEALIKGETPLTINLNDPCTDTGLYPLHCAALSFFPSVTELFLYHGAQAGNRFTPRNPSNVFPQHLLEAHTNKLPLHMALHGISCLPCIREWNFMHSIPKLVALLCLPRMQDALETLGLLAMTTKETEEEFLQLAKDGEFVELTALLIVAHRMLHKAMFQARDRYWSTYPIYEDQRNINKSGQLLCQLFDEHGDDIAAYVKEDKYDVSKYQVMEDVVSMIKESGPMMPLDIDVDLTLYNWYRIEESSYPSEAPYEYTSRSPDVGMEHYSKSSFRWRGLKKQFTWRKANRIDYKYRLEHERIMLRIEHETAKSCLQKKLKPATFGIPYICRQGVPIASSSFFSHNSLHADTKNQMYGKMSVSANCGSTRAISSLASLPVLQNLHSRNGILAMTLQLGLHATLVRRAKQSLALLLR